MIGSHPCNISFHNDQLFHCTISGLLGPNEGELPVTVSVHAPPPQIRPRVQHLESKPIQSNGLQHSVGAEQRNVPRFPFCLPNPVSAHHSSAPPPPTASHAAAICDSATVSLTPRWCFCFVSVAIRRPNQDGSGHSFPCPRSPSAVVPAERALLSVRLYLNQSQTEWFV